MLVRNVGIVTLVLALGLIVQGAAASGARSAEPAGRILFLEFEYETVHVQLASTEPLYFLDPVSGQHLPRYTVEDAERIAAALDRADLGDRLVQVLVGNVLGERRVAPSGLEKRRDPRDYTLFLEFPENTVVVRLHGDPSTYVLDPVSGERYRRFSVEDGEAIRRALEIEGLGTRELVRVLVNLKLPYIPERPVLDKACDIEPLDPSCNECLDGSICNPPGGMDCCPRCDGPPGCQKCGTC